MRIRVNAASVQSKSSGFARELLLKPERRHSPAPSTVHVLRVCVGRRPCHAIGTLALSFFQAIFVIVVVVVVVVVYLLFLLGKARQAQCGLLTGSPRKERQAC